MGAFPLVGDVDLATSREVLEQLLAHAESDDIAGGRILIDCSGLTFIDSTGVSILDRVSKESGKGIVLVAVPAKCRRVFEITGMDHVFELVDQVDEERPEESSSR
jgi:anti-sigma B factor antagonist